MKITKTSIIKKTFKLVLVSLFLLVFISCSKDEQENILLPPNISIKVVETVYLPDNSIDIKATVSDDGQIKKILWKKIKGGTANFKNNQASISISNLEKGDYVFKIIVTDDHDLVTQKSISFKVDDSRILYSIGFESSKEGFLTSILGDFPAKKPLLNVNEAKNHCGRSFRGKKAVFVDWKGYSYKANDSFFLATNMGSCLGYFTSALEKEITFSEDYAKGHLKIQFDYYMPGDFSKWGNYGLTVNIYPLNYNSSTSPLATFSPKIDSKGWVSFKSNINTNIVKGNYKLVIVQQGGQTAIDNIYFYKTK